jgi:eukaryotic-like serine/threonine-protein kinase
MCTRGALAKDPAARFPSMEALGTALASAAPPAEKATVKRPSRPVLAETLDHYEGLLDDAESLRVPRVSVNFGAAGIALFFQRASVLLDRAHLLAVADQWLSRANLLSRLDGAFYDGEQLTEDTVGRSSLFYGPPGVLCVAAIVAAAYGDLPYANAAATRFLRASRLPARGADITTGVASSLLGCAMLREALGPGERVVPALDQRAHELLDLVWRAPGDLGRAVEYLGMAHGWAGRVYATLRWCRASGDAFPDVARERVEHLVAQREVGRRGVRWPLVAGTGRYWPGWCHGAAGYVFLWSMLAATEQSEQCAELARLAAEETCAYRAPGTGHLCCGSAGQGYACLSMYRLTGGARWIDRARRMLTHARTEIGTDRIFAGSLYKGELGIALLEADLARPDLSAMPFFESEG